MDLSPMHLYYPCRPQARAASKERRDSYCILVSELNQGDKYFCHELQLPLQICSGRQFAARCALKSLSQSFLKQQKFLLDFDSFSPPQLSLSVLLHKHIEQFIPGLNFNEKRKFTLRKQSSEKPEHGGCKIKNAQNETTQFHPLVAKSQELKKGGGGRESIKLMGCQLSSFPPIQMPNIPMGKSVVQSRKRKSYTLKKSIYCCQQVTKTILMIST